MHYHIKFTTQTKLAILALPLFLFTPHSYAHAESTQGALSRSSAQHEQFIQLASAQRQYNFRRASSASQNYFYRKKKKKFRSTTKRKSYRQRLKDVATWQVDESNKDPVQLIVSRSKQTITVYKGADVVATSNISSGKRGHATPTGVFSILGKRVFHRSNIYSRAPMPYMQRLTWSGIALHASNSVPAHPASHGCVRLPNAFAPKLFKFTERGAHVIIADEDPRVIDLQGLTLIKPLLPKQRAVEYAKLKAEHVAKEVAARKAAEEKAAQKAPQKTKEQIEQTSTENETKEPEAPLVEFKLSDKPLRILITRRLGRERVRDVQDMLRELGFAPGESDGYMGKDTGKAIMAFQEAEGLQKTGAFSDELESALYKKARKKAAPTGYIYVRQGFRDLLSSPITIQNPEKALGTHLITAQHFTPVNPLIPWRGMTLKDKVPDFLTASNEEEQQPVQAEEQPQHIKVADAGAKIILVNTKQGTDAEAEKEKAEKERRAKEQALDKAAREKIKSVLGRISLPQNIETRLSLLLTPGSSIAISDKGLSKETTPHGTDFILLTR